MIQQLQLILRVSRIIRYNLNLCDEQSIQSLFSFPYSYSYFAWRRNIYLKKEKQIDRTLNYLSGNGISTNGLIFKLIKKKKKSNLVRLNNKTVGSIEL